VSRAGCVAGNAHGRPERVGPAAVRARQTPACAVSGVPPLANVHLGFRDSFASYFFYSHTVNRKGTAQPPTAASKRGEVTSMASSSVRWMCAVGSGEFASLAGLCGEQPWYPRVDRHFDHETVEAAITGAATL